MTSTLQRARSLAPSIAACIQLAHAGRKASSALPWEGAQLLTPDQGGWETFGLSSGGVSPEQKIALGANYQVPFARAARLASGLPTTAVGLITDAQQAEAILRAGDADLIALARAFLYEPRWGRHAAAVIGGEVRAQPNYWRCPPREAQSVFGKVAIGVR